MKALPGLCCAPGRGPARALGLRQGVSAFPWLCAGWDCAGAKALGRGRCGGRDRSVCIRECGGVWRHAWAGSGAACPWAPGGVSAWGVGTVHSLCEPFSGLLMRSAPARLRPELQLCARTGPGEDAISPLIFFAGCAFISAASLRCRQRAAASGRVLYTLYKRCERAHTLCCLNQAGKLEPVNSSMCGLPVLLLAAPPPMSTPKACTLVWAGICHLHTRFRIKAKKK